jgi:YHS domain-containing protein
MLRIATATLVFLVLGHAAGCAREASSTAPAESPPSLVAPPPSAAAHWLTPVTDASEVCMVNNTWMGRPQIAVPVDGKTYFGCCEACKARLGTDPSLRAARDPFTGAVVDKATAVMAYDDTGAVYYFASRDNMRRYRL